MAIAPGDRLGAYQIVAPLGAGGMGEVWRATDTTLGRDVAIKVLPAAFSADAERLARFEREAKLLASLNHPNLAGIYGLHEHQGGRFLAMELVPGEDLAERPKRGPLPIGEALDVARQIAEALETAHEQGIIHRDLKPANVRITPDGKVKVLDFGLAKALENAGTSSAGRDAAMSPTITSLGTMVGVVLGTAAYMSPEQARGKGVDKRADIWAFGCVLYEMITGRRAFDGETVSDTLAAVLAKDVDWSALPTTTPSKVRDLLQRCLDKDPKRRMRDIGDARIELEEVLADRSASGRLRGPAAAAAEGAARTAALPKWVYGAMLGCVVLGAVAAGLFGMNRAPEAAGSGLVSLDLMFPPELKVTQWDLSPDGAAVVALGSPRVAPGEAEPPKRVYVRSFKAAAFAPVAGTEGATNAFFSARGEVIAALPATLGSTQVNYVRLSLDGSSPPYTFCASNPRWTTGSGLYDGGSVALVDGTDLVRIGPQGGEPSAPVKVDLAGEKGIISFCARALPDDNGVLLYTVAYGAKGWYYRIGVLDLKSARITYLLDDGGFPYYSPTGHILFSRGDTLLAVAFDRKTMKLTGSPFPVRNGLQTQFAFQPATFALSDNSVLAFVPGGRTAEGRRVGLIDTEGKLTPVSDERHAYQYSDSSASDGRRYVTTITNGQGIDELWLGEFDRPGLRRLWAVPDADLIQPILSPDGRRVALRRRGRSADDGLYLLDLDGGSPARKIASLPTDDAGSVLGGFTPDGSALIGVRVGGDHKGDVFYLAIPAAGVLADLKPIITEPGDDKAAALSPDGRWLAYTSDVSGRQEVCVAAFHGGAPAVDSVRVTRTGGTFPHWSADSRQLRYTDAGGRVIALSVSTSAGFSAGAPKVVFDANALNLFTASVLPDGRQLVVIRGEEESDETRRLAIVLHSEEALTGSTKAAR